MLAQIIFSRNKNVIAQRVHDETVLFDMETGNYYSLNELGSRTWELLEERLSLQDIAERLATEYDAPVEIITDDLQLLLDTLVQTGLLLNSKAGDGFRG
jgi:hypothetical protein